MIDRMRCFRFALNGIVDAVIHERNFRLQWLCGLLAVVVTKVVGMADWQIAVVLILTFLVLAFELQNCAIEKACDSTGKEYCLLKKRAKDFSAASVLLMALASALVFFSFLATNDTLLVSLQTSPRVWSYLCLIALLNLPIALNTSTTTWYLLFMVSLLPHALVLMSHHDHVVLTALGLFFHGVLIIAYTKQVQLEKKRKAAA